MGKIFINVGLIVALGGATACLRIHSLDSDYKVKPITFGPFPPIDLSEFMTCDQNDADQKITTDAAQNSLDLAGHQADAPAACPAGTKSDVVVKPFSDKLLIGAPIFHETVSKVRITNARTCTSRDASSKAGEDLSKPSEPDANQVLFFQNTTRVDEAGNMELKVVNSHSKLASELPIHAGNNLITIEYFGKCLQYAPAKEGAPKDAQPSCNAYESLGQKSVLLRVAIKQDPAPAPDCK